MQRPMLAAGLILVLASVAQAQWRTYENAQYGYRLHIPPGADEPVPSDSGDGVTYTVEHGQLRIYGAILMGRPFADEAKGRRDAATAEGWKVSHETTEPDTATYDMSRGGTIRYIHGIELCDGAAAFFEYDYHRQDVKVLRAVFQQMVKSLQATGTCVGSVATVPYPTD